jgi:hypothetical protein
MENLKLFKLTSDLLKLQNEFYELKQEDKREMFYNKISPLILEVDELIWETMPRKMAEEAHFNILKICKNMEEKVA